MHAASYFTSIRGLSQRISRVLRQFAAPQLAASPLVHIPFYHYFIQHTMTQYLPAHSRSGTIKNPLPFRNRKLQAVLLLVVLTIFGSAAAQAQCDLILTPANINPASCGGNDGSFQIQTSGIEPPYEVQLFKDVNGSFELLETAILIAGTPTYVFQSGGTYQVMVNKDGTCTGSVTVELPQETLTLTPANINPASCGGNDGSFQVQTSGIEAPYTIKLYKDVNGSFELQETATLIAGTPTYVFQPGGTYQVVVSKGDNCSGSVIVELPQETLTLTPANIHPASCGGNDGSFQVQTSGIEAPYTVQLYKDINGSFELQETATLIAGTPTYVFQPGGTYQVVVSKGDNCTGSVTVELPEEALSLAVTNLQLPTCGGSDGSFQVQTSGIEAPYQVKLFKENNGTYELRETATQIAGLPTYNSLPEGSYRVGIEKGSTCNGAVDVYLYCETIGKEGCGPGYWKNTLDSWEITNYSPQQTVESVFNVPDQFGYDEMTLLAVLQDGGGTGNAGAGRILLRAATAAILNAAHRDVDYSTTLQYIITQTNTALNSGNKTTMLQLTKTLDKYNNQNCPFNDRRKASNPDLASAREATGLAAGMRVKAMPNPSAGAFNLVVETSSSEKISLLVIDMQGRLLERMEHLPSQGTFRFGENFIPGVYIAEVVQGKERRQLKLVKTR